MPFTQENRFLRINTPLGEDVLLLARFSGTEGVSTPFMFALDLASRDNSIIFKDIIGKSITVSVDLRNGQTRYFNGIIMRFSQGESGSVEGEDIRLSYYSATVVPWFWLLTKTADSRIFQGLSVPDIVEKVFKENNLTDFKLNLHGSYEKRDYCVQYRESDFNFISRLLEEEGIYYFFEHEDGKHTMVLADVPDEHRPCPNQESVRYYVTSGSTVEEDTISNLDVMQEIKVGKYTLNDFNFITPSTNLKVEVPGRHELGPGEREIYDYPGRFMKRADGDRLANIRMQEEEAEITTISGSSNCRAFGSGYRFTLQEYYRNDMNDKDYVLLSVNHMASQEFSGSGGPDVSYINSFTCMPFNIPFRPSRDTLKPYVEGVQTAIVVGPGGEEIYTDEHGRVKVQFHWDREGNRDENSSCWIRVSQAWAGAGWGAMYIPRIGHEVIVSFVEGDPDRPIITGRVYHGNNKPPYDLPGEKTKSTIKSDSSLGGGGSNEFRFEDKKGSEEIFLHGQKDWTIAIENDKNQTVGHDETLQVGNDRTKSVGVNQSETIGSNKSIQVGANHTETIGANMSQTVGAAKAETIGAAKALSIGAGYQISVGAAMNESVGAAKSVSVGANSSETVGKDKAMTVGANSSEKIGKDKTVDAGGNISESAEKNVAVNSGKKMVLSSEDDFSLTGNKKGTIDIKDQLTIKCGSASITLKKNGDITINGKMINIKGSGDVKIKGSKIAEN